MPPKTCIHHCQAGFRPYDRTLTQTCFSYCDERKHFPSHPSHSGQHCKSLHLLRDPFLPVLDLGEFLEATKGEAGTKKISLVLFQAVMFAGSAFVDIHKLHSEGFATHKHARSAYYERVRVCQCIPSAWQSVLCRELITRHSYCSTQRWSLNQRHSSRSSSCSPADLTKSKTQEVVLLDENYLVIPE